MQPEPSASDSATRIESDLLGEMRLAQEHLYGVQTARAVENFPITGVLLNEYPELVRALAMVKKAAALANEELGTITPAQAEAIVQACDEIIAGRHHQHFVVDMVQGGAGTSTNMNANEVIANVGLEKMGRARGDYVHLHPNDHVNRSQSTNDAYPTAVRVAVLMQHEELVAALQHLAEAFSEKAKAFSGISKVGRTQLQDAVPMTLGMEFASFAVAMEEDAKHLRQTAELLRPVNLGGTAIGTGIAAPAGYCERAIAHLSAVSGYEFSRARDLIEASSDLGALVSFSGALKRVSIKLSKICNDLRLLSSGPRAGLREISLPAVQPGSSIMPGKVNPVIPEVVTQVAYQVMGNDVTVAMAAEAAQFQLNAMEPVVVFNVLNSIRMLTRAATVLRERCVVGIQANAAHCEEQLRGSLVLATALVPHIGYEKAVQVAKTAQDTGATVLETLERLGFLSAAEFQAILASEGICGSAAVAAN
ncbi:aspartate ammonia-lyase [Mesorhizobium sp. KR1-2]|uniref:aspartate ammonia-lyase n=1 Tax=Mesorhizobium sp. KR1-2 TaxID=3156609 RepID=UPI0032B46C2B